MIIQSSNGKVKAIFTYRHLRNEFGGVTAACMYAPKGKTITVGFSFCSPSEDNFNKLRGRKIAEARLERKPVRITREGGVIKSLIKHLKLQGERIEVGNKFLKKAYKDLGIDRYVRSDGAMGHFLGWFPRFADDLVVYK